MDSKLVPDDLEGGRYGWDGGNTEDARLLCKVGGAVLVDGRVANIEQMVAHGCALGRGGLVGSNVHTSIYLAKR